MRVPVREPRLLVVANPYESAMIRRAAEYAGVHVSEAEADDVDAALRETEPDVVVVAAALAHGEGVSVIGRLSAARGRGLRPRLIAVGGEGTPVRSVEDARRLGADEFLPRPVDLEGLVARVMRAAGRRVTGPMPLVDLRSVVAARVEADLSGALDDALGAVSEPRVGLRTTLPMPTVAPPAPAGGPSPRTTLPLPPPSPAPTGGPSPRTTLRMPTTAPAAAPPGAAPTRDTLQMAVVAPERAADVAPPGAAPVRDTLRMTVVPGAAPDGAPPDAAPVRDTVQMTMVVPEAAPDGAPPGEVPPTATPRVLAPVEAAALRARVEALLPLVDEGDYFAVLGLPRDATVADVQRAWRAARQELEPSVVEPALGEGLRESVAALRRVLDEALRVLSDDRVRDEYRAHL